MNFLKRIAWFFTKYCRDRGNTENVIRKKVIKNRWLLFFWDFLRLWHNCCIINIQHIKTNDFHLYSFSKKGCPGKRRSLFWFFLSKNSYFFPSKDHLLIKLNFLNMCKLIVNSVGCQFLGIMLNKKVQKIELFKCKSFGNRI